MLSLSLLSDISSSVKHDRSPSAVGVCVVLVEGQSVQGHTRVMDVPLSVLIFPGRPADIRDRCFGNKPRVNKGQEEAIKSTSRHHTI